MNETWPNNPSFDPPDEPTMEELCEELESWVIVYGCRCGHPHCRRCQRTKTALELVTRTRQYLEMEVSDENM